MTLAVHRKIIKCHPLTPLLHRRLYAVRWSPTHSPKRIVDPLSILATQWASIGFKGAPCLEVSQRQTMPWRMRKALHDSAAETDAVGLARGVRFLLPRPADARREGFMIEHQIVAIRPERTIALRIVFAPGGCLGILAGHHNTDNLERYLGIVRWVLPSTRCVWGRADLPMQRHKCWISPCKPLGPRGSCSYLEGQGRVPLRWARSSHYPMSSRIVPVRSSISIGCYDSKTHSLPTGRKKSGFAIAR